MLVEEVDTSNMLLNFMGKATRKVAESNFVNISKCCPSDINLLPYQQKGEERRYFGNKQGLKGIV